MIILADVGKGGGVVDRNGIYWGEPERAPPGELSRFAQISAVGNVSTEGSRDIQRGWIS